jgi:hypothetical protein
MRFSKKQKLRVKKILNIAIKVCLSTLFKDFSEKILNGSSFQRIHIPKLENLLQDWKRLFPRFVPDETEQLNLLAVLEEVCIENSLFIDVFHVIVQYLNSDDFSVLSDSVIKEWAQNENSSYPKMDEVIYISDDFHRQFVEKMKKYI